MAKHCTNDTNKEEIGQTVSLPVLDSKHSQTGMKSKSGAPMMGRTRMGRWRAIVLTLVNLLMIAHLIQWAIAGTTIAPIEPSEAMETLEVGVINAGAILFLLTFLSTLIFGRFFCGWLCHMVALQDLCAYMMNRIGIRPKPFRSRLLIYFPFALGMYMFVWPTFKRVALAPLLKSASVDWPIWLKPVESISQYSTELIVDDFWATMPPWYIAVVFLFICGFAAVYFLGAKGFCTYGCPYAAFFKPMDKVAPMRIRVDDSCEQCGYCTSACTSNVRVSEEVRDFGMVVDAGCMKTLDCISACPNDALSLGFGKPAFGAKPRSPETYTQAQAKKARRYDMTMGEEIFASVLFLWFFFATRGLLDAVPMLMAGGLAAIGVMIVMTSIKLFREQNARLYTNQLKSKGKLTVKGYLFIVVALGFILGSLWSGQAKAMRWRADVLYASSDIPTSVLMRPEFQPSQAQRKRAQSAAWAYQRGDSIENGGMGWELSAEHRLRLSYFLSILGRNGEAYTQLERVIEKGQPTDQLIIQAGQLLTISIDANPPEGISRGDLETLKRTQLLEMYQHALSIHPQLHAIRTELARSAFSVGDLEKAEALWAIHDFDEDPSFYLAHAGYTGFANNMIETQELYAKTAELALTLDHPAGMLIDIGRAAIAFRLKDVALDMAQQAVDHESATALTWLAAGELANASGLGELGTERAEKALTMPGIDRPMVQARAAGVLAKPGNTNKARKLLADAASRARDPFEIVYIAQGMARAGLSLGDQQMLDQGMAFFEQVTKDYPDLYIIGHDYSSMLFSVGNPEAALTEMLRVAQLDSTNPVLAMRVADIHRAMGNEDKVTQWLEEYENRKLMIQD
ncbi:hypothetical protein COB72_05925 [bacterium]|nr:MAG: hypothetical protein COB72_05925 [bacterium]